MNLKDASLLAESSNT